MSCSSSWTNQRKDRDREKGVVKCVVTINEHTYGLPSYFIYAYVCKVKPSYFLIDTQKCSVKCAVLVSAAEREKTYELRRRRRVCPVQFSVALF